MPYGFYIFLMLMIITLFGFKKGKATYKIDKIPTFMFP
jgi:hypothetical protein